MGEVCKDVFFFEVRAGAAMPDKSQLSCGAARRSYSRNHAFSLDNHISSRVAHLQHSGDAIYSISAPPTLAGPSLPIHLGEDVPSYLRKKNQHQHHYTMNSIIPR